MKRKVFSKTFYFFIFFIAIVFLVIVFVFDPSGRFATFIGSGSSMEPTLFDGDELVVDTKREVVENDIIVFDCLSCPWIDEALTKRVQKIDEHGCFWVVGDNPSSSFDSKDFGWLCEDDIGLIGVVSEIKRK